MRRLVKFALATVLLTIVASSGLAIEFEPHPVLEVSEWNQNQQDFQVTIRNPGSSAESGFLVISYSYNGTVGGWGLELDLAGGTEEALHFDLNGESVLGVGASTNDPTSITDAPEPVARIVKPIEEDNDGSGGAAEN
jgi:hypothetical protein